MDAKAAIIQSWIDQKKLNPVDPHHLIFAIWSTTQHYADFDIQVKAVLGDRKDVMPAAERTLVTLLVEGLKPR